MLANRRREIRQLKAFLLENRNSKQTVTKNTFWLSFGEIVGRAIRFFIIIYAARVLGRDGFGIFSYLTSLAAVLTVFSDIGLSSVVIREITQKPALRDRYFSTAFFLKMILVLISFLAVIFIAPHITKIPISRTLVYLVGLIFIFDSLKRFGSSLFRAEERMEIEALINLITQVVIVAAGFAALTITASPESLAAAYAFGGGIGLLVSIYILRSQIVKIHAHFDKTLLKPITTAAWPLSLAAIFGVLMVNIDTVLVGWFRQAEDVGSYAAAQRPIAFLYLLPTLITGAFFPALSRLANKNNEQFRSLLEKGLNLVMFIAVPLTVGMILTAPDIVTLFYGSAYAPAAAPLRILALTLLTVFPIGIIINGIFAYNRQNELTPLWTAGLVFNLALSLVFIPRWGISGAAWAGFLTQIVINSLIWRKMKKINNFSLLKEIRLILLATFMMSAAIILTRQMELPFLVIAPLAVLVYFGSLFWSDASLLNKIRAVLKSENNDYKPTQAGGNNLPRRGGKNS